MSREASVALNRFGLGARGDETAPREPRAWLLEQLDSFDPRPPALAHVARRAEVAAQLAEYYAPGRRTLRPAAAGAAQQAANSAPSPTMAGDPPARRQAVRNQTRRQLREHYLSAIGGRTNAALVASAPFVERLVHFWSNHFAVSADRLNVVSLAGSVEFDAIRPHVLGRFADMLLAVEQHPAMLLYLDQFRSVGPRSMLGERISARGIRKAGINENLAREILELHTLGVNGGYSQADVTEFARALTGWTTPGIGTGPVARAARGDGPPGDFHFASRMHEPGPKAILGKSYAAEGVEQARAVLLDLAVHPATARHIATKLARHFAADDPPAALVERLSAAYLRSGGHLPAVYRVLIEAPEVWNSKAPKFRTPWEWSIASLRAVGTREIDGQAVANLLNQLGQPVWRPGSPAGYDDLAASWASPEALVRRVQAAERIAGRATIPLDARRLALKLFPETLSRATAQALARAESPGQGLALLLVAPEFLRR